MASRADLSVDIIAHDRVTPTVKNIQSGIIRFVGAVSAALAATRAVVFPIQSAAEFEKELKNVQKTTGFTNGQIDILSDSLNEMSGELLASQVELAQIAATAGQLGLGREGIDSILAFTRSVAQASATFDVAADVLSNYAAQILNVFNIPTSDVERIFSTINEVSNNSVASAAKLIDIIKRVGNVSGLTVTDVTALAATTQDVGVSSEVAGTTLVKQFSRMQSEAKDFAAVMGVTTEEWTQKVEANSLSAFKEVLLQLSQLDSAAQAEGIKELFGGGRIFALASKQVADAANGFQILDRNLRNANGAFIDGQSSIREYAIIASSADGQTKQLGNAFRELAINAGNNLLPLLKEIISDLTAFANSTGAQNFFESLSESLATTISALRTTVEFLAQYELVWRNIIPLINAFIAFKLVKVFLGLLTSTVAWTLSTTKAAGAAGNLFTKWSAVGAKLKETLVTMGLVADANARAASAAFAGPLAPAAASGNSTARSARSAQTLAETQAINAQTAAVQAQQAATAKLLLSKEQILKTQLATNRQQIASVAALEKTRNALTLNLKLRELVLKNRISLNRISAEGAAKELASIVAVRNVTIPALDEQVVRLNRIIAANVTRVGLGSQIIAQLGIQGAALSKNALAAERQARATAAAAGAGVIGAGAFNSGSAGRNVNTAARGLTRATTAARGFGGAIRVVGRLLSSLILGPIGTLVVTIGLVAFTFKEQFADFFGFVTSAQIDANARFLAREKKTAEAAAKTSIEIYRNELNAAELSANIGVNLEADDGDIRNAAQEQVAERTEILKRRLEGVNAETARVSTIFDQWTDRLGRANQELAGIDNQFAKLSSDRVLDLSVGNDVDVLRTERRAAELAEKRRAAADKIAQIEISRTLATEKISTLNERQLSTLEEQKRISELLIRDVDARTFDALRALEAEKQIEQSIDRQAQAAGELTAEKQKLDEAFRQGTATEEQEEDLRRINEALVEYNDSIKILEAQLDGAVQETGRFASRVEGAGADTFIAAQNMDLLSISMAIARNRTAAMTGQLVRSEFVVSGATDEVGKLATKYKDLGVAIAEMDTGSGALQAVQKSLQGLQDNLINTANFARKAIQELFSDAEKQAEDAQRSFRIDREVSGDINIRAVDRRETREVLRLEEAIAAAKKRGDTGSAEFNERRLEDIKEAARIQRAGLQARIEFRAVEEQVSATARETEGLEKEITENLLAQKEAKEGIDRLKDAKVVDPEAIVLAQNELLGLTDKFSDLTAKISSSRRELVNLGQEASTLGNTNILADGLTLGGGVATAVSSNDQRALFNQIKEADKALNELSSSAVVTAKQSLSETLTVLETLTKSVKGLRANAFNALEGLVTPEVLKNITAVADKAAALAGTMIDLGSNSKVALQLELGEVVGTDLSAILKKAVGELATLPPTDIPATITPKFQIGDQLSEEIQRAADAGQPYNVVFKGTATIDEVNTGAVSDGATNPRKFATGGYIRGPGSGTSDSILARLSDKEYVIKAAAVRKYGVGYLHALNSMQLNNLPAFATGGQVNAASAAQALSGSTGGEETNVNLTFNGRKATLRGQKEQAREFVDMLRSVEASL